MAPQVPLCRYGHGGVSVGGKKPFVRGDYAFGKWDSVVPPEMVKAPNIK